MRVVIIGSGNVAESLAIAIGSAEKSSTLRLTQIFGRNELRVKEIAELSGCEKTASNPEDLATAELYILAVSDSAIKELASTLPFANGSVVAHTAGSVPLDALPKNERLMRAVLYPMQTFSKGRRVNFSEVPLFVEADDSDGLTIIRYVAKSLSNNVIKISSERRAMLHLGAIFTSNFVNAMLAASYEVISKHDLPLTLYDSLIRETLNKTLSSGIHPMKMQTGPAVRGDRATIERHIELMGEEPEMTEMYKTISTYIWETSKKI